MAPPSARLRRKPVIMSFSIVLVDDHKLVRDGIKTILERGTEFHVVGTKDSQGNFDIKVWER